MRQSRGLIVAVVAVLLPIVGNAQVYHVATPPPATTAETAAWQVNSESLTVGGLIFYPTAETRFFDSQVMVQIGTFQSVPIYADATLEPWSVVYVPVSRGLMRTYERRRDGAFAGTEGSRVSAFPVDVPTATSGAVGTAGYVAIGTAGYVAIGTAGNVASAAPTSVASDIPTRVEPIHVESIPAPTGQNGIWIEYAGTRWYMSGAAVPFEPSRFVQIGEYRGFPVFRSPDAGSSRIWIPSVDDGPLTPYAQR